eukprot:68836-Prymnesium_polylepis.2
MTSAHCAVTSVCAAFPFPGARRSFAFLPAVPKAELPEGSEPAPKPLVGLGAPLELQKESPLELQEIPFEGAGVGHV